MGYTINSCKKIVWNDGSAKEVQKVVYCDPYGSPHIIWPCRAELTNVYITEVKSGNGTWDIKHPYTAVNGEPSYYLKPSTNPGDNRYAITGTIIFYKENGVIDKTVENCYFFAETTNTVYDAEHDNGVGMIWDSPDVPPYGARNPSDGSGTAIHTDWVSYAEFLTDDTVGHVYPRSIQVGWYGNNTYVQNGFIFDKNYATPFILKRADVIRNIRLYTSANGTGNENYSNMLKVGDSITFYPRYYDYANHSSWDAPWTKYTTADLTINDFTYGSNQALSSSDVDITVNSNNHSFTVTPRTAGTFAITIGHSTNSEFTPEKTFNITATPEYITRIADGGGNDLASTTKNLSSTMDIYAQKCTDYLEHQNDPLNMTWTGYDGNVTITSSNTNAFTCSDGATSYNKRITPVLSNAGASSTITVTLGNGQEYSFTAVVASTSTYYTVGTNGTAQVLVGPTSQDGNQVYWNYNTGDTQLGIFFTTDGSTPKPVYVEQGDPSFGNGRVYLSYTSSNNTSVLYIVKGTAPDNGSTLDIPVYTDSSKSTLIGTITLHIVR